MTSLITPSADYQESFLEALREFQIEGRNLHLDAKVLARDFDTFLQDMRSRLIPNQPGRVPENVYWLVDGDKFIGRAALRHRLNPQLNQIGGHIGYEIRPSQRRRGYGKMLLRLALPYARELGLNRVLITCDDTNIGSAKIIEANGGKLENIIILGGRATPVRRYWITLS